VQLVSKVIQDFHMARNLVCHFNWKLNDSVKLADVHMSVASFKCNDGLVGGGVNSRATYGYTGCIATQRNYRQYREYKYILPPFCQMGPKIKLFPMLTKKT
jgi:hypothetical protein